MPLFMVLDGRLLVQLFRVCPPQFSGVSGSRLDVGALTQSSPDLCELDVLLIDMASLTSTGMPICVMSTNIHRVTRFAAFCSSVCARAVCEWLGRGR